MLVEYKTSLSNLAFNIDFKCDSFNLINEIERNFLNVSLLQLRKYTIKCINMIRLGNTVVYSVNTTEKPIEISYTIKN